MFNSGKLGNKLCTDVHEVVDMSQINLNTTPEFERDLREIMGILGVNNKSSVIRKAVEEYLTALKKSKAKHDFSAWIGAGISENMNPAPKFSSNDALWEKDGR